MRDEPVSGFSTDTKSAGTFNWVFIASITMRNNICCLSHSAYDIQLQQSKWTNTHNFFSYSFNYSKSL